MQVVSSGLVSGKKVLLRMDLDVPIKSGKVSDDFRLKAGLETLDLCLNHAQSVTILGHIGRPEGKVVPGLSVKAIVSWFEEKFAHVNLPEGKLHIMENLRFENGEDEASLDFAKELAGFGDFFVNEAFASHHQAASTTVLPTLLPHAAGLRFAEEVKVLSEVRDKPKRPQIVIIGGAKLEDKLAVVQTFAQIADALLVGGKFPEEIRNEGLRLPANVLVAKMNEDGTDLSAEAADSFARVISGAKQVVWSGPLGFFEKGHTQGIEKVAKAVIESGAESIIGGGDTITALTNLGLIGRFSFVSTGGGAMLEFLVKGTLPAIEALEGSERVS